MWSMIKQRDPIWYIDATGGVHVKINGQKATFLYSIVCHDVQRKQIIPVFEFITTSHTSESIAKYITYGISRINQNPGTDKVFSLAPIIVMDFSYAIINGVLNSCNNCSLTKYIDYCYNLLKKNDFTNYMPTHIYLCSTHFLKSMIKKTKLYRNKENGYLINTFIFSFSLIQNAITMDEVENNFLNVVNLFNSKYKNQTVEYSLAALRTEIINRELHRINVNNISTKVNF